MVNVINKNAEATIVRILDVSEELFATKGFNATSMRMITQKAGVNLAAINYHFGTKDQLIIQVIQRGIRPINESRLEMVENVMTRHSADSNESLPLKQVLDAFYRPAFEYFQDSSRIYFLRLLGRTLYETGSFTQELIEKEWMPLILRFLEALKLALPNLTEEEILWRFHFAVGSMVFTISQFETIEAMACADPKISEDFEPAISRLISFTAAGFLEPTPPASQELVK